MLYFSLHSSYPTLHTWLCINHLIKFSFITLYYLSYLVYSVCMCRTCRAGGGGYTFSDEDFISDMRTLMTLPSLNPMITCL